MKFLDLNEIAAVTDLIVLPDVGQSQVEPSIAVVLHGVVLQDPVEQIVGITQVAAGLNYGSFIFFETGVIDHVADFSQRLAAYVAERCVHEDGLLFVLAQFASDQPDAFVCLAQVVLIAVQTQEPVVVQH